MNLNLNWMSLFTVKINFNKSNIRLLMALNHSYLAIKKFIKPFIWVFYSLSPYVMNGRLCREYGPISKGPYVLNLLQRSIVFRNCQLCDIDPKRTRNRILETMSRGTLRIIKTEEHVPFLKAHSCRKFQR